MPSKVQLQVNNFIQGLITEANQLSTPEKASLDEINMQLLRDGSRRRRLGLDMETGGSLVTTGLTALQLARAKHSFFSWPNPSGSAKVHIGIVQIANRLYFIDLLAEVPSTVYLNGGNFITADVDVDVHINFTLYHEDVVGVSEELDDPFLLTYNETTDVVKAEGKPIKIRDLYGIDDGLNVDERPTILSEDHLYNLGNQGWSENIQTTCTSGAGVIDCTFETIDVYPSNSDTWTLGKEADVASADIDRYNPELLKRNSVSIGQAAKGRFIIDLYNRGADRSKIRQGASLLIDRELGRISTVTSFAGRLFYSGIRSRLLGGDVFSPQLSGAVLFSQIAKSVEDLVKCYQEADPTSPEQSDIVDTDGGIIIIPGASAIVKLLPVKASLFVFAETGVWQIKGEDGGFKATSFQVQKITSVGTQSPLSVVEANGTIFYWAEGGIYSLAPDKFGEFHEATNITLTSIQTLYSSLPSIIKRGVKAFYDVDENTIRWLYASDDEKIVGDPIDIQPEDPPVTIIGTPAEAATGTRQLPLIARLTDSTFILYYKDTGFNTNTYYKIGTINSDLSITYGAETLHLTASQLSSVAIVGVADNKVLVCYKNASTGTSTNAIVGNILGDVVTWGTGGEVTIDTTHTGDTARAMFELKHIVNGECIFGAKNTDNSKIGLQIVTVDLLTDIITFGSVSKSVTTSATSVKISLFTSLAGMIGNGGVINNIFASVSPFTITGDTIVHETVTIYTNNNQHPIGSHQFFIGDVSPINTSKAFMIGGYTISPSGTTHGTETMILDYTTGTPGTMSSLTSLNEEKVTASSPTTQRSSATLVSGKIAALVRNASVTPNTMVLHIYTVSSNTPVTDFTSELQTAANLEHPISERIASRLIVQAWSNLTNGTIESVAHRIS